jgi:hypothetical protein
VVLPEYGTADCLVAKTGSRFRGALLWPAYHGGNQLEDSKYVHPVEDSRVKKMSLEHVLTDERISIKYLFVREPLMRYISAYLNKILDNPRKNRQIYLRAINWKQPALPTLGQFFHLLALTGSQNEHFKPFFLSCNPCLIRPDLIGRQETLMEDMTFLVNNITALWKSFSPLATEQLASSSEVQSNASIFDRGLFDDVNWDDVKKLIADNAAEYEAFGYDSYAILSFIKTRKEEDDKMLAKN